MSNSSNRSIIFLGIREFPIAVERVLSKSLIDRPIVVAQNQSSRAVCVSVSKEAREMGISRGMRLYQAKRRYRGLTVLQPNPLLYDRATQAMHKIVREFSPLIEISKFGQFYLDLTGCERLYSGIRNAVYKIKMGIRSELKLLSGSGIATNKLVSRIAAIDSDTDGLIEIEKGSEYDFLAPHFAPVLPAVDKNVRSKLIDLNIRFVKQVREIESEALVTALGTTAFSLMKQAAGVDYSPVTPAEKIPQLKLAYDFDAETNDPDRILIELQHIALDGIIKLKERNQHAKEIRIIVIYGDGKQSLFSLKFQKVTKNPIDYLTIVIEKFLSLELRRVQVKRIELNFIDLHVVDPQLTLFDSRQSIAATRETTGKLCNISLLEAVQSIKNNYGASAIQFGVHH